MVNNKVTSLKIKRDFKDLVEKGQRARADGWLTLDYLIQAEEAAHRIQYGLSISRKIGSAVVRNKLKRWSREFFRHAAKSSSINCGVKLNLRLRENGDFYKKIKRSEFVGALGRAWEQIRKKF